MDCSIDLPNQSRISSQLNEEFQSLIKRVNKILNQSEFDVNNGEYVYKEHCNELRRQVQLAKETQIQQIEEIADKLMNEIDEFEKGSLETVSKVNKEQLVDKLNKMKQENEKWNQRLDEFKVDNQMLNQLRDSLSKIAFERDNFKSLLHNKMMKFNEYKNQSFVGKLSQVSLDSINEIEIDKHFEKIVKKHVSSGDEEYDRFRMDGITYEFSEAKVLSNGDLLFSGQIDNEHEDCQEAVLALFDLNKGLKIKKIKQVSQFSVYLEGMEVSLDRICLNYYISDVETEDDDENEVDDYVVSILNENLKELHRYKSHEMKLIGANDSFLFFSNDSNHKDGVVSFYTWSMEYVKTIGQSNDPSLPFYIYPGRFANMFGRYYYKSGEKEFKSIDEETGLVLNSIEANDYCFNNNYNLILSDKDSIKYLSFNGDLLKEIKIEYGFFLFIFDKDCLVHHVRNSRLCFWNKYNEETHEVAI